MKKQRLVAFAILIFSLFNFPIISLFNKNIFLFGIPIIYLYVFTLWLVGILVVGFLVEKTNSDTKTYEIPQKSLNKLHDE
jgi:hypothetical protein